MPPKKKGKAPPFYTSNEDLQPYSMKANGVIITPLGLKCSVLGVKYGKRDDPESSSLWVQHRLLYESPIDEDFFEDYKCLHDGERIWKRVLEVDKVIEEDEAERFMVEELNRKHREEKEEAEAKKKKKKPKPAEGIVKATEEGATPVAKPPDNNVSSNSNV